MKKTILFCLALGTGIPSLVHAQTKDGAPLPVKTGNEWQMPRDVLVRARNFSTYCQKLLSLDSATTQKFFELYLGNTKSVDEIRVGNGSEKDKKAALDANRQQFDQNVRPLLTPGQWDGYVRERKAGKLPG